MKTIARNELPQESSLFPIYTGDSFWLAPHNGHFIVGIPVRGIFGIAELQNDKLVAVAIAEFAGANYFADAIAAANMSIEALEWAQAPERNLIGK